MCRLRFLEPQKMLPPLLLFLLLPTFLQSCSVDTPVPNLPHRLVHLDLKGAPPKIVYYVSLFPFLASMGVTGLLLEYEDMFPYHGPLKSLARSNAYSRTEVMSLLELARQQQLEVIPLIQTFGHMEFVLKHRQFFSLREVPSKTYTVCPSDNGTHFLIQAMVDQIMELHPGVKWLHIGSDEVFDLGKCHRCHQQMKELNINKTELFLNHVISVAKYVHAAHSVEVIIWDDILQTISEEEIKKSKIGDHVVPMVWKYHRNVWNDLTPSLWEKYTRVFPRLWIASAFKGATGQTQVFPYLRHHLDNHCSWMEVVRTYANKTHFLGIALTGWQRYNHDAPLCELLPVGIPSLTLDLMYLQNSSVHGRGLLLDWTSSLLQCHRPLDLDRYKRDLKCSFPGSEVFAAVLRYNDVKKEKLTSPGKVVELKKILRKVLGEIFYEDTVEEWIDTHVKSTSNRIEK